MSINWIKKNKIELIILLMTLLVFNTALYIQMHGYFLTFKDTDDYMQVIRIKEFFSSYDLSDNIIRRCNVPYGCSLHWTRFYDFFLIIPSYILSLFIGSIDTAVDYICFCASPIIQAVTILVLLNLMQKLMDEDKAFLCLLLFIVNLIIAFYGNFGRPDHHAFILLFIIIFLRAVYCAISDKFCKHHISVARLSAVCIWISPETLIPLLLTDGVLFLYALINKRDRNIYRFLYLKSMEIAFDIALLLIISDVYSNKFDVSSIYLSIGLLFLALCIYVNRRRQDNIISTHSYIFLYIWTFVLGQSTHSVYYDEISVVHYSLYLCIAAFFNIFVLRRKAINLKEVILIIGITVGVFLFNYPKFLLGMAANVTPYVKEVWLSKVAEMQSPFELGHTLLFLLHSFFGIVVIGNKLYDIYENKLPLSKVLFWLILIINAFCYIIFASFANRMLMYSCFFNLPLIVDFCMSNKYMRRMHRLFRIFMMFFMNVLFMFVDVFGDEECDNNATKSEPKYQTRELFSEVDNLSVTPTVIMAHSNDGPAILYYTKHSVIGAPYHRQEQGIIASYEVMENKYNEAKVKKILEETGAEYIFIVKSMYDKNQKSENPSLPAKIILGNYPKWLRGVKLPEKFNDIIIMKIERDKLKD